MSETQSDNIFIDRLLSSVKLKRSHVVVGLDPRLADIPDYIKQGAISKFGHSLDAICEAILQFNHMIIDAVAGHAVAVKPQVAFYEKFGYLGMKTFAETIEYAKVKGLLVIADVKRNDIGSTVEAYSGGYLGKVEFWNNEQLQIFNVDCITTNAYFGVDGIEPFISDIKEYGKGIFVLVKTSNQSSIEIQDLETKDGRVYEVVARLVDRWGNGTEGRRGYKSVGAVVGATYPEEAAILRNIMPKSYFLVPGYGAQGATAKDITSCFNDDGLGAVVNSARDIIFAYKKSPWKEQFSQKEFDKATKAAVIKMKEEINAALQNKGILAW